MKLDPVIINKDCHFSQLFHTRPLYTTFDFKPSWRGEKQLDIKSQPIMSRSGFNGIKDQVYRLDRACPVWTQYTSRHCILWKKSVGKYWLWAGQTLAETLLLISGSYKTRYLQMELRLLVWLDSWTPAHGTSGWFITEDMDSTCTQSFKYAQFFHCPFLIQSLPLISSPEWNWLFSCYSS